MKLITFVQDNGPEKIGALTDDGKTVVDLSEDFSGMLDLIDAGPEGLQTARDRLAAAEPTATLDEISLQAPIPVPRQIRDCMLFEKHLRQAGDQFVRMQFGALGRVIIALGLVKIPAVWYEQPVYYKANRFSVIGPDREVIWPAYSERMDFECEIGVVIGRKGVNISPDHAAEHIFGYTIFNDMSARDAQFKEMKGRLGPAKGKDFDTGNIIGPYLVTADEIADPYNLTMIARVNGEEWGRGNSGEMHHRFEDLIAHVSRCETIYPGELLGSGTVGNGCGLEHGRFLAPGDVVELEIDSLGVLRNRLVKPFHGGGPKCAEAASDSCSRQSDPAGSVHGAEY